MQPTIAHYEIIAEIGQGALATVYRAHDPRLRRDVAIKLLRPEYLADLGFRTRFEQEATVVAALAHPAIIHIYEFGQHEGQLYLVMAYMANGSLAERVARGPLPPAEVTRILARVATALDFAHENGIVHRDLKPSNILFDEEDYAYLGDFGIALQATAGGAGATVISGTPAYMSPEQARRDAAVGSASDLYALAATTFQMLTGALPFSGDSPVAILLQHLHEPPPSLHEVAPDLPRSLDSVLKAALAKDPAARYPTAAAFVEALTAAFADPTSIPPLPRPAQPTAPAAPPPTTPTVPPPATRNSQPATRSAQAVTRNSQLPSWLAGARRTLLAQPLLAFALVTLLAILSAAGALRLTTRQPGVVGANPAPTTTLIPGAAPSVTGTAPGGTEQSAGPPATSQAAPPQPLSLQLLYDEVRFTVINVGAAPVGLGDITFHRDAGDTLPDAAFGAAEWGGVAGNVVNALPPGHCFQLVNLGAPGRPGPTEPAACADLRGWIGTSHQDRLPFTPGGPTAFEVRRAGAAIQTCTIDGGTCLVEIP